LLILEISFKVIDKLLSVISEGELIPSDFLQPTRNNLFTGIGFGSDLTSLTIEGSVLILSVDIFSGLFCGL
jgi:hypothetical protein